MDPDTRDSLIVRLADADDAAAWELFTAVYRPMLFRLAQRWGLQDADAHDLVQEVLLAVSHCVGKYEPRDGTGSFRGWLAKIARHKFADLLSRQRRQAVGTGQTDVHLWLSQLPDKSAPTSRWDLELRRELFQWAASQVRQAAQERTWEAFQRTAIDGQSVETVAAQLGISAAQVYVARSRVMSRIRRAVEDWSNDHAM